MNKSILLSAIILLLIGWVTSCTQVDITMPKGPKGDTGLSAYEFWKEKVVDGTIDWSKDQVEVTDFFKYLKGKDGRDGVDGKSAYEQWKELIAGGTIDDPHKPGQKWPAANNTVQHFWKFLTGASGENGQTPHIGANGNWFIGTQDTGVPARGKDGVDGKDGKDATPPVVTIGANGNWYINGTDTGKPSRGANGQDGKDGQTPTVTIGDNGNWYIDGVDTGKPSRGADGKSPEVAIGENGNWWIDGKDTGKPAYGSDGQGGANGKSAYELWKESVEAGCNGGTPVMNPKNPTLAWDCGKTSQADFWEFLRGADGKDGLSAYEIWKEKVADGTIDWPKNEVEVTDFFKYLKGKDGRDGVDGKSAYEQWKELIAGGTIDDPHNPGQKWPAANNTVQHFWKFLTGASGENGQTPHIGANGNWFIGTQDTGVPARGKDGVDGKDGKDATPPVVTIGANGNWYINGTDTGKPSRGADGKTPAVTIGDNGNWYIDGTDTGKPAVGKDGKSPEVIIGENGNWWIDGKDTGKPAYGKDGKDGANGTNGKSAYELWKESVDDNCGSTNAIMDPHNPGLPWDCSKTTTVDFWEFLRGADGSDGENAPITVEIGKFNVIPQYWNADMKEYVSPRDGAVTFQVYGKDGKKAPAGAKVKGLPGMDPNAEFTTDKDGLFKVPFNQLPNLKLLTERKGATQSVTINGVTEPSSQNTMVPNRINIRVTVTAGNLTNWGDNDPVTSIDYKVERQVNGAWNIYPSGISGPSAAVGRIKNITLPVTAENISVTANDSRWRRTSYRDYIFIARPYILTSREEQYVASLPETSTDTEKLKMFRWDGTDHYFGLIFGDGAGVLNDYGQIIYAEDKILSPEINPVCSLKNVKLEIKEGISTLWGEFEVRELDYFYLPGSTNFIKDDATKVWKPKDRKQSATSIPNDYTLRLYMTANNSGTYGYVTATSKSPIFTNSRFALVSAYSNNLIRLYSTYNAYYRDRYAYYLRKDASNNYYLEDYYTKEKIMDVPLAEVPTDWTK